MKFFSLTFTLAIGFLIVLPLNNSNEVSGRASFSEFLDLFEEHKLPYALEYPSLKEEFLQFMEDRDFKNVDRDAQRTLRDYLARDRKKFSRMGPPTFEALAALKIHPKVYSLVYKSSQRFREGVSYYIANFNKKGKLLNKELIATTGFSNMQTFAIDAQGTIEMTTYKNIWKKDYEEEGFDDNEIVSHEKESSTFKSIQADGTLKELTTYAVDSKASLD